MSYLEIALLAVIQGAAELLPVSSSAHVILAARCLGYDPSAPAMVFLLAMLHTGTMFAVLWYFWPRWRPLLTGAGAGRFIALIVLATAVTGVVGLGLMFGIENLLLERWLQRDKGEVEELFKNLPLVAAALAAAGVLILVAGFREPRVKVPQVTTASALWIGLVQGLCLPFRGFSRSGATISTALLRGIPRPLAEDYSFALAVLLTPPVVARAALRLLKNSEWTHSTELGALLLPGLVGMAFSFVAGLVALRLLSAMLERGKWRYFGYYCLVAALVMAGASVLLPPLASAPTTAATPPDQSVR